jgi:hypothetical protein
MTTTTITTIIDITTYVQVVAIKMYTTKISKQITYNTSLSKATINYIYI